MNTQDAPQTTETALQLPDIDALITKWLQHERTFNQAGAVTLATYAKGLRLFADWLRENNDTRRTVTASTIAAFRDDLEDRYAGRTVSLRLIAVRRFYSWMVITGRIAFSPAEILRKSRRRRSGTTSAPSAL